MYSLVMQTRVLNYMDVYQENGYENREDYLRCLADDYGVSYNDVLAAANILGGDEDFDGLVSFFEEGVF